MRTARAPGASMDSGGDTYTPARHDRVQSALGAKNSTCDHHWGRKPMKNRGPKAQGEGAPVPREPKQPRRPRLVLNPVERIQYRLQVVLCCWVPGERREPSSRGELFSLARVFINFAKKIWGLGVVFRVGPSGKDATKIISHVYLNARVKMEVLIT